MPTTANIIKPPAIPMAQPLFLQPAPAYLTASKSCDDAAHERQTSGPFQSMQVRTLGWHIPTSIESSAEDLFSRLHAAVASIGTVTLSGDCAASTYFMAATVGDGPEPMTALLWVVPSPTLGGHHVCIRRATGDTFVYHNFYRKVRQASAACE